MSVFIGIILSDATLQKGRGDARLQFKQKYSQFEYFYSVFFQLSHYCSKSPVALNWKSLSRDQLSNSGDILKPLVPNNGLKAFCGWGNKELLGTTEVVFHNHSYKVISQMMTERVIDNRGSKSTIVRALSSNISVLILIVVKEQRVYGS